MIARRRREKWTLIVMFAVGLVAGLPDLLCLVSTGRLNSGIIMDSTRQEYRDVNGDGHITDCEKLYPELMEAMLQHETP